MIHLVPTDCVEFNVRRTVRVDFYMTSEFLEDIQRNGIVAPLEGEFRQGKWQIIDGTRRLMAAKILGIKVLRIQTDTPTDY